MRATVSKVPIQGKEFEQICEEYQIKTKVEHIICDNAANMKKAFTTCFPGQGDEEDELDDSDIWNDLTVEFLERKNPDKTSMFCTHSSIGYRRWP